MVCDLVDVATEEMPRSNSALAFTQLHGKQQ